MPEEDHLRSKVDNTRRPAVSEQLVAALSESCIARYGFPVISEAIRMNSQSQGNKPAIMIGTL
jgi:hypothetical protein